MSDDICVNIFAGVNGLLTSLGNSIFQNSGNSTPQQNWQGLFIGLMVLIGVVLTVMQAQQRSKVSEGQKPSGFRVDRLDRN